MAPWMLLEVTVLLGFFVQRILGAPWTDCGTNEYPYQGLCCKNCPAGTYASQHCDVSHGQGKCRGCIHGEDYTSFPNGLDFCQSCNVCREDQVRVRSCSQTENTVCQCKPGRFCDPEDSCEICFHCTSCRKGQTVKYPCTATADTVCEDDPAFGVTTLPTASLSAESANLSLQPLAPSGGPETQPWMIIVVALLIILCSVLPTALFWSYICSRHKKKTQTVKNEHRPLTPAESNSTIQSEKMEFSRSTEHVRLCTSPAVPERVWLMNGEGATHCASELPNCHIKEDDWPVYFYAVAEAVPPNSWKKFVRALRLKDNDIDRIARENTDVLEQNYQMLKLWRNQTGNASSTNTLFGALEEINLGGCIENIINDLKGKGILLSFDTVVK